MFAILPEPGELQAQYHFYEWLAADEYRFMCSWDTTDTDIEDFIPQPSVSCPALAARGT